MLATVLMGLVLVAQAPAAEARAEVDQKPPADSPERAVRSFIIAMMTRDLEALRALTLPVDDLDALLPPQAVAPEDLDELKELIDRLPVRLLKAGEEVELVGGRTYRARAEDAGPDRALVFPENTAFPLAARRIDGRWRIDAAPVIASMRPAAAARPSTPPRAVDVGPIKDKVAIKPGRPIDVRFQREGDALSAPEVLAGAKDGAEAVHFDLSKEGRGRTLATRNPFSKNLVFRAAVRHEGRASFVETSIVPVRAGLIGFELWREPIEELVLFDFKLEGDAR